MRGVHLRSFPTKFIQGQSRNRGSTSAFSARAYTANLYLMVDKVKRGGRVQPPLLPAWANFSIMMESLEFTPESGRCHSVYSVGFPSLAGLVGPVQENTIFSLLAVTSPSPSQLLLEAKCTFKNLPPSLVRLDETYVSIWQNYLVIQSARYRVNTELIIYV